MRTLISILRRVVKYSFYAVLCVFALWAALGFIIRNAQPHICVELPNGLRIDKEAVFNTRRHRWKSIYVLKLPDGTILIPDVVNDVYFTKTTVYGNAGLISKYCKKLNYDFAYRPDTGLAVKSKDPKTYERLVREAGPLIWLTDPRKHYDLQSLYIDGTRTPSYRRTDCKLSFFP